MAQVERKVEWLQPRPLDKSVAFVFRYGAVPRRRNQEWRQIQKLVVGYATASPADRVTCTVIRSDYRLSNCDGYIYALSSALHSKRCEMTIAFPKTPPSPSPQMVLTAWLAAEMQMSPGLHVVCPFYNGKDAENWMKTLRGPFSWKDVTKAGRLELRLDNGSQLKMVPGHVCMRRCLVDICVVPEMAYMLEAEVRHWRENTPVCITCTRES